MIKSSGTATKWTLLATFQTPIMNIQPKLWRTNLLKACNSITTGKIHLLRKMYIYQKLQNSYNFNF